MPELPEVQTVADHIKPDLIGKYIVGIEPVWKKYCITLPPRTLAENIKYKMLAGVQNLSLFS